MTRKTALLKALELLSKRKGTEEIREKLEDLLEELHLTHWSEKSIKDRCEQFIEEEKRNPTLSDFRKKGMPPHTVIKQKFGISLQDWLDENYPTPKIDKTILQKEYTKIFIKEYKKIKPQTASEFDERKTNSKTWRTVALYNNATSWRKLIEKLNLPLYKKHKPKPKHYKFQIDVKTDIPFFEV